MWRYLYTAPGWRFHRTQDTVDPPIHTEYFRSGGATTLTFMVDGAKRGHMVVPPDNTTLPYKSSWIPLASSPMKLGWIKTSG